jgi:hypothetical protein
VNLAVAPFEWESLNNGYLTTQFYTVALDHGTPESPLLVAGAQDNNQLMTVSMDSKAPWTTVYFGDGSYCAMEDGAKLHYFSKQLGKMIKATVDASGNRTSYARIDPVGGEKYLFINPFLLDPTDNNTMYLAGGKYLWRNNKLRTIPMAGNNDSISFGWTKGTDSIPIRNEFISAIGVSSKPAHRVYYGSTLKRLYRVDSADLSVTLKPKDITAFAFPSAYVSCVAVDPRNADRLMVSFSNYNVYSIFNSVDGGKTFNKAAGNLEQFATGLGDGPSVRWLSILPVSDGTVYLAATSAGFFATDTLMGVNTKWVQQASGEIGNMVCDMFDVRVSDGTIGLATHGNGVFSAKIVKKGDILGADYLEKNQMIAVKAFPNPSSKNITIQLKMKSPAQNIEMLVLDVLGRKVNVPFKELTIGSSNSQTMNEKQWDLDVSQLKTGVYYVRIEAGNCLKTIQIQVATDN